MCVWCIHSIPRNMSIENKCHPTKNQRNLRQVMWISHCGKPVSVCDGSDSDCWLMECGYITSVGEWDPENVFHGGCDGHL